MTILFLFIIPLSVSAAQEKVSVKGKAITVKEAINIIEKIVYIPSSSNLRI